MGDFKQFRIVSNGVSTTYSAKDETARNSLANKVDKITGKGLSTNDFTDELKTKLDGIQPGAQVNPDIDTVLSDSSENPVQNRIIKAAINAKAPVIINTASGEIASFSDGADGMPVKRLEVAINPVQEGSGDPSPENVRPISGWTGAKVTRTGKNLLPHFVNRTANGITWSIDENTGAIYVSGTATAISNCYQPTGSTAATSILNLPNGNYIISGGYDNNIYLVVIDGSDGTRVSIRDTPLPLTVTQGYITIRYVILQNTAVPDGLVLYPMIRLASDADPTFEPYQGKSYSVSWQDEAGTVYGGTLNVTTGELTVDRKIKQSSEILSSVSTVTVLGSVTRFWLYLDENKAFIDGSCRSNVLPSVKDAAYATDAVGLGSGAPNDENYKSAWAKFPKTLVGETVETIKAYLTNNPFTVLYPLATPITYQLTPQQIDTLLGTNNVWADTGEITAIDYPADTKLYIDSKIAAIMATMSET